MINCIWKYKNQVKNFVNEYIIIIKIRRIIDDDWIERLRNFKRLIIINRFEWDIIKF